MNKFLIIIIITIVLFAAIALCTTRNEDFTLGDVNKDKIINEKDYQLIENHILKGDDISFELADVNSDNVIDIIDYTLVRLHVLGVQPLE